MDVREKLVKIIQNSVGGCARYWAEVIADGLIANGVIVIENDLPNPSLEEMGLSVRAHNALKRAGLNTAKDISELNYMQILRIRNLGKHTYDEVIEKLKTLGYNTETLMPPHLKGK